MPLPSPIPAIHFDKRHAMPDVKAGLKYNLPKHHSLKLSTSPFQNQLLIPEQSGHACKKQKPECARQSADGNNKTNVRKASIHIPKEKSRDRNGNNQKYAASEKRQCTPMPRPVPNHISSRFVITKQSYSPGNRIPINCGGPCLQHSHSLSDRPRHGSGR